MTAAVPVDDPADPRLVDYLGLRDPERRVRIEREQSFFIGESELVVRRMISAGAALRSVLVTPRRLGALADVLDQVAAPVFVAPEAVLRAVVGFDLHRGVVAAADRPVPVTLSELLVGASANPLLVLERLNDHENLGGVFRSAAALGAGGVLLCPQCCDPLYRRCVRVSMGHVLTVPWVVAHHWPGELTQLRDKGYTVAALTPRGETELDDWAGRTRGPVALLLGAEGPGLSEAAMATADVRVRIAMQPGADSLNVSVAAAIALFAARA